MKESNNGASLYTLLLDRLGAGELGRHLASGAGWIFIQRAAIILLTFITQIILSRGLGAKSYGAYAFALAWVQLLVIPALLGMDRVIVREVARSLAKEQNARLHAVSVWGFRVVLVLSLAVIAVSIVGVFTMTAVLARVTPLMRDVLLASLPLILLLAIIRLRQAVLIGLDHVRHGQTAENVVLPSLFLVLVVGLRFLFPSSFTPITAVMMQVGAGVVALVYVWRISAAKMPDRGVESGEFNSSILLRSGIIMLAVAGVQVLNARIDILMVGSMMGAEPAGIYSVANRGAVLLQNVPYAVSVALLAHFVAFHTRGDYMRMGRLARKAARIALGITVPGTILLILFGKQFLGLFGPDFVAGYRPLVIMSIAECLIVLFGSSPQILMMTGNEIYAARAVGVSAGLNAVLNLILIPRYGMIGAAWALATGQFTASLLMAGFVRWKLGIWPTVISFGRESIEISDRNDGD